MKILILFILCSNYLIHPNVAIKNHQYQSSLSKESVEGDLSDLYGRDDDYSEGLGISYYLNTLVYNYIYFWSEDNLNLIDKTIFICTVKEKNSQNGYRQLGLIGNFLSTHSYRDCTPFVTTNSNQYEYQKAGYNNCREENDKANQQKIIALTAKVLGLTKR